jgi:hypothetical protein
MTVGDGWPNTTYREEPEDKRADCNKKNTSCSQRKKKGLIHKAKTRDKYNMDNYNHVHFTTPFRVIDN